MRREWVLLSLICLGAMASADDVDYRTWTDHQGRTLEARLERRRGNDVELRTGSGKVVRIALDSLSEADRAHIEKRASDGSPQGEDAGRVQAVRVLHVPFFGQKPDYCGEACLQMLSAYLGKERSQDEIHALARLPKKRRGIYWSDDLEATMRRLDIDFQGGFDRLKATRRNPCPDIERLKAAVDDGQPVLLGIHGDPKNKNKNRDGNSSVFDHFVLFVGYAVEAKTVFLHDPARGGYLKLSYEDFDRHRGSASGEYYTLTIRGMRGGRELVAPLDRLPPSETSGE